MSDNPLRIFTASQLEHISVQKLKSLKKEILLEFQFSDGSQVNLNGHLVDKNDVLDIFSKLEENLDEYLKQDDIPALKRFFDDGNISFLMGGQAWIDINNLAKTDEELQRKIVRKFADITEKLCTSPINTSYENLKLIKAFIDDYSPANKQLAFSKAQSYMEDFVSECETKIEQPFASRSGYKFKANIGKYVNLAFFKLFEALPETFEPLANRYCLWCNNKIIFEAVQRSKNLQKFPLGSLRTIQTAARIAGTRYSKDTNVDIANSISAIIQNGNTGSESSSSVKWVFLALFLVIKFTLIVSKCSSSNSQSAYNNSRNSTYNSQENTIDALVRKAQQQERRKTAKTRKRAAEIGGDETDYCNLKLTNTVEKKDATHLYFSTDVIPGRPGQLYQLIPAETARKYKGKVRTMIMHFTVRGHKSSTVSHKFKIESKDRSFNHQYAFVKNDTEDKKPFLSGSRVPFDDYRLSGSIQRVGLQGKQLSKDKFTIRYNSKSKSYKVKQTATGKTINIDKAYIKSVGKSDKTVSFKAKMAAVISNMMLLNNKHIKEASSYTVSGAKTYEIKTLGVKNGKRNLFAETIEDNRNVDQVPNSFEDVDIITKMAMASAQDNIAYVEAMSAYNNLKFYVDYKTGIPKGMTMTTVSADLQESERIQLWRQ